MIRCGFFVLAGCNSILGLGDVKQQPVHDARVFDAPIDAAPQCPPIGVVPTFRPAAHSLPFGSCGHYSISDSANRAMAFCTEGMSAPFNAEGELEGVLAKMTTEDPAQAYFAPHMGADGDLLARVAQYASPSTNFTVELQHRDAPLMWSRVGDLPYQPAASTLVAPPDITNPSAGPEVHIIILEAPMSGPPTLREFANVAGSWQQVDSYAMSMVSMQIGEPSLSADALRMVFFVSLENAIYYSDRATTHDRFRPAQQIAGIPPGLDAPVMNTNCGKLYFSAIGTVLFLEQ